MTYLLFTARCVLGLVFAVSAFGKLRDFAAFRSGLAAMRVVPKALEQPVAILVTALEIMVPLLMLLAVTAPAGLVLAAVLLAGFGAAIVVTLARGTVAACPCFGPASRPFGRRHVLRNAVLTLLAAGGAVAGAGTAAGPPVAGAVIAAAGALVVALLVISYDELADLVAGPVRR